MKRAHHIKRTVGHVVRRGAFFHLHANFVVDFWDANVAANFVVADKGKDTNIRFLKGRKHIPANADSLSLQARQPIGQMIGGVQGHRFHIEDFQQIDVIIRHPQRTIPAIFDKGFVGNQQFDFPRLLFDQRNSIWRC